MFDPVPNQKTRDLSLMALSQRDVVVIFVLYFLILLFSSVFSLYLFVNFQPTPQDGIKSLLLLINCSVTGGSIYYARKLYKAGINSSYNFNPLAMSHQRVSTLAYFAFRIPISAFFAVVTYCLWRLSLAGVTPIETEMEGGIKYILVVIGFFSGFSAGKLLTSFDEKGASYVSAKSSSENI